MSKGSLDKSTDHRLDKSIRLNELTGYVNLIGKKHEEELKKLPKTPSTSTTPSESSNLNSINNKDLGQTGRN